MELSEKEKELIAAIRKRGKFIVYGYMMIRVKIHQEAIQGAEATEERVKLC